MSNSSDQKAPHVALLPSSGMGHLTPFLRLAATLVARGCTVAFITIQPTVSSTESLALSHFFSAMPQIRPMKFQLLPFDPSTANSTDPFFLQVEAIRQSAHLLSPLLSSSSPHLSALITDISISSAVTPVVAQLHIPNYILFTSSAAMLALVAYFPTVSATKNGDETSGNLEIPGFSLLPKSLIPPALHDPTNLFTTQFVENGRALKQAHGILINTFEHLESKALSALNSGTVVQGLPPVLAVGPLETCEFERRGVRMSWLDAQPTGSVVYVSFGSRTILSREQMKELADGLEKSGCRFLWVVKSKVVDKEEEEELGAVVGEGFLERVAGKGLVVKDWVDQGEILGHPSVGGFVSHCGWNSVSEAAWEAVPLLAWPQSGDQSINAQVVEESALGIWVRGRWGWGWGWGCGGEKKVVVMGEEIGERVRELMMDGNESVRAGSARVGEAARRAVGVGGTSDKCLMGVIHEWKKMGMEEEAV